MNPQRSKPAGRKAGALLRTALPEACHRTVLLWIDGAWRPSRAGRAFATVDPTEAAPLIDVAEAGPEDVDEAVAAARRAQPGWWAADGQDRARILRRVADAIRSAGDALGLLDTLDAGRPIRDTRTRDVERAARLFEFFAGTTDRLRGATVPVQPGRFNFTQLEPYGAVAAITPWNYPLTNAAGKIAPALATGNAVILKPAEESPLSALLLACVAHQAGLPAGLLNVVNGPGSTTGQALAAHGDVGKICFTGSTEVGRRLGALAGQSLKSVTLELGGKTAFIVFPDADLDRAVEAAAFSAFNNAGQTCTAATRLLLHRSLAERFVAALGARAARVRIGDPLDAATQVGPLIAARQRERFERYRRDGEREGARYVPLSTSAPPPQTGYFVAPALLQDVRPEMRVAREEIFGPLLAVMVFGDEEEAVSLANATEYGLASTLWIGDLSRAHRLADRLNSGLVWVNTVHSLHPGSPYGGYKSSGLGNEMGQEAVHQHMRVKSVWIETQPWHSPWAVQ